MGIVCAVPIVVSFPVMSAVGHAEDAAAGRTGNIILGSGDGNRPTQSSAGRTACSADFLLCDSQCALWMRFHLFQCGREYN